MRKSWDFFSTEQIVFGNGAIQLLPKVIDRLKGKNIFLIMDQGIKHAGILDKVMAILNEQQYKVVVYDKAIPEPPVFSAVEAYQFAKQQMDSDVIIGLGGGSSIDLAKVVAILMKYGGHPTDYFGGENAVPGPIHPLIAIPTTAGTGSEVTSVAVVNDTENEIKVGISDNYLRPKVALLDPELTVGLPAYVTACSGIDALAHAIEAYTAKPYHAIESEGDLLFQGAIPISDTLAEKAIDLIANNLVKAVQQGSNLEAREKMMLGSLLAGMAFSNAGTALAHALAYPIGGKINAPHGEVTGLLLPYVMKYNKDVSTKKMAYIARAFGVQDEGKSEKELAHAAHEEVSKLVEAIGLPTKLSKIGIKEEDLPFIAEKSIGIDRLARNNPRQLTVPSLVNILKEAY